MLRGLLIGENAVKRGNFTLTSGRKSEYYADIKDACTRPNIMREIVSEIKKIKTPKAVGGVELGAVPILVALAYDLDIPYTIIRKESNHGMKKLLIGHIESNPEITLIEDVVTTGGSLLKAVDLLRENGCTVKDAITVIDREEGGEQLLRENHVELKSLLKIKEIF